MPGSLLAEPDVLGSTLGGEARGFRAETNNLHQTPTTPAPENLGFDQSVLHLLPCPAESKQFCAYSLSRAELNPRVPLGTWGRGERLTEEDNTN